MNLTKFIKGSPLSRITGFVEELREYADEQQTRVDVATVDMQLLEAKKAAAEKERDQAVNVAKTLEEVLN